MRAFTVDVFAPVAISTKNLKPWRKVIFFEPAIEPISSCRSIAENLAPVFTARAINMINCEKCYFCLSTTRTDIATICLKNSIFENLTTIHYPTLIFKIRKSCFVICKTIGAISFIVQSRISAISTNALIVSAKTLLCSVPCHKRIISCNREILWI